MKTVKLFMHSPSVTVICCLKYYKTTKNSVTYIETKNNNNLQQSTLSTVAWHRQHELQYISNCMEVLQGL